MTKLPAYWRNFYQNSRPLYMLLLAYILCSSTHLNAQEYYETLQQELQDEYNLPMGTMVWGDTYAETLSNFYLEQNKPYNPADTMYMVDAEGVPFNKALRVVVSQAYDNDWRVVVKDTIHKPIKKGDVLLMVIWVKGISSRDETGGVYFRNRVNDGAPGDDWISYHTLVNGSRDVWEKRYYHLVAPRDAGANGLEFTFFTADQQQTYDLGGLAFINYGTSVTRDQLPKNKKNYYYEGKEENAPWRAEAEARIDQIRKSNLTVIVKDSLGNLVKDAKVEVKMKRHAFLFGSLVEPELLAGSLANKKYQETFLEHFNFATLGTFNDTYKKPQTLLELDAAVDWLRERDIPIKMGTLVYPQFYNVKDVPAQEIFDDLNNNIRQVIGRYKGKVQYYNVLNEGAGYLKVDDALQSLFPGFGRPSAEWFKIAHEVDPDALLEENDYGKFSNGTDWDKARRLDSALIKWGAPLHIISDEGHQPSLGTSIPGLISGVKRNCELFGKRTHITEFDMSVDFTDPEEVATSSQYLQDYYTALFSQECVDAITVWGYYEPTMWDTSKDGLGGKRKAWWLKDWTIQPKAVAYRDLVLGKWWTNAEGTTDTNGEYTVRVFKGTHEVIASKGGIEQIVTATITSDSTLVIILTPDTVAPTQPKNLTASNTSTTVTLSWEASSDDRRVTAYDVYSGDSLINSTDSTETTIKLTGLTPAISYSLKVQARDFAGNLSPFSEALSVTTDSVQLKLTSVCSPNPYATRGWEVKNTYDTTRVFSWNLKGTLIAGVDTVEANSTVSFETPNTGGNNAVSISWIDLNGAVKSNTATAGFTFCDATLVDELDNFSLVHSKTGWYSDQSRATRYNTTTESIVYKRKDINSFMANIRNHTDINSYADIAFSTSVDGITWTPVSPVAETPNPLPGGWSYSIFRADDELIPAGTQYIKIEVKGGKQPWATGIDRVEINYDPTPETITCKECIAVTDPLEDWTKSYSHSNWYFAKDTVVTVSNAGDLSRAVRYNTTTESIVWNYSNIKHFTATLRYHATYKATVKLYTSADDSTYTEVAFDSTNVATEGGWFKRTYSPKDTLAEGVNFLKLEISGGTQSWATQVGQVDILYTGNPCTDCEAAMDSLNSWNKSFAHTNWYLDQDAVAQDKYNYDKSRAVRNSTGTESIIWKYNKIEDFNASINYHTTFPADVKFYTSPDNVTYTLIPAEHTSKVTSGGWYYYVYTPTAEVPDGTNYLKLEVAGGAQAWTPQVSQMNILYHEAPAVVLPLTLTSVCSDDPTVNRRWRIRNENSFAVAVNWTVYGTNQAGTLMAPAGDSYFLTNTVANSANTTIISWADGAGITQQNTKASSGASCSAKEAGAEAGDVAERELAIEAAPNPAVSHFILSIPARGQEQAQVLIHNAMGRSVYKASHALQAGVNRITISTAGMAEGIQFVRVIVGNKPATPIKVLVTR